jgi:hypothetical protein
VTDLVVDEIISSSRSSPTELDAKLKEGSGEAIRRLALCLTCLIRRAWLGEHARMGGETGRTVQGNAEVHVGRNRLNFGIEEMPTRRQVDDELPLAARSTVLLGGTARRKLINF